MSEFNIYEATPQEMCDYAVKQIVKQGDRCVSGGDCVYGDRGKHCAVGWLIPKDCEVYEDIMGYMGSVDELIDDMGDGLPEAIKENEGVLLQLQSFHDHEGKNMRKRHQGWIAKLGINTTGEHWQTWVDMGAEL